MDNHLALAAGVIAVVVMLRALLLGTGKALKKWSHGPRKGGTAS